MTEVLNHSMPRTLLILTAVLALSAANANASIAIFTDGRTIKVTGYRASEQSIELSLASGGMMQLPLARIERIIDDEFVPQPVVTAILKSAEAVDDGVFPKRSWKYDASRKPIFSSRYDSLIIAAARKYDVDAALVSAVIKAESDFNPNEISNKGARGLMQLMPATAERFGVVDALDPAANISAGVRYLHWLLNTFDGNADLAVAAYNAGEGNVWKYNGIPPFRETVNYIHRIARHIRSAVGAEVTKIAQKQ